MNMMEKVIRQPLFYGILAFGRLLPDTVEADAFYLRLLYRYKMHRELNLENPQTFNEKLQWLKLYDRRPEYTTMVDKYAVKAYVAERIGEERIIPTLGVWNRFEDIDFESLPEQFVLKATHDSGGIVICRDKAAFDLDNARKTLKHSLKRKYFRNTREWPYKDVKPRIIAEQYMEDGLGDSLKDYKLHCFSGEPKMTLVCSDRFSDGGMREDFFDKDWEHMPIKRPDAENSGKEIDKPVNFEQMQELARKLSQDIPFVRTDFYEIDGKVYFGEMTFFPASGFKGFVPEKWDVELGRWIKLKKSSGGGVTSV